VRIGLYRSKAAFNITSTAAQDGSYGSHLGFGFHHITLPFISTTPEYLPSIPQYLIQEGCAKSLITLAFYVLMGLVNTAMVFLWSPVICHHWFRVPRG
jgi:hypothetical protein